MPAGQLVNLAGRGPLSIDVREALFVDGFEVTRAQWFEYQRTLGPTVADELSPRTPRLDRRDGRLAGELHDRRRGRGDASSVGMRLPTAREWIFIAAGPQGLPDGRDRPAFDRQHVFVGL